MNTNSRSFDHVTNQQPGRPQLPVLTAQRRAQVMCQMRGEGRSLAEIGAAFGVTRERARQIIRDAGGPGRDEARAIRQQRRESERLALKARIVAALQDVPGQTADEVAVRLRLTPELVRGILGADAGRLLVSVNDWREADPDEALLEDLREAARRVDGPLTCDEYERVHRDVGGHSPALITIRFGYWRVACERAGVECGSTRRGYYRRSWTPDQMIDHVAHYLASPGAAGTFDGYCSWAQRTQGAPSGATVRNVIGSWAAMKRRALIRLADRTPRAAA